MLASVWCRTTSEAVLTVYAVGGVVVAVLVGFDVWPRFLDPWSFLESAADPGSGPSVMVRWLLAWLGWSLAAAICLGLAAWQLRPSYIRQLIADSSLKRHRHGGPRRPPVSDLPVRWKERFVVQLPLLRWLPRSLALAGVSLLSALLAGIIILSHLPPHIGGAELWTLLCHAELLDLARAMAAAEPAGWAFQTLGLIVALCTSLVMGIRCSAAVSGERERKTWEGLLLTPLEPPHLIRGKLWGAIDAFRPFLFAWWLPALVLSVFGGFWAVVWSAFWWAGTWVLMYFFGASAVLRSVQSSSSWRSLLGTLVAGCGTVLERLFFFGVPLGLVLAGALVLLMAVTGIILTWSAFPTGWFMTWHMTNVFLLGPYLMTGISLFATAEQRLQQAGKLVAQSERIPQGTGPDPFRKRELRELSRGREPPVPR